MQASKCIGQTQMLNQPGFVQPPQCQLAIQLFTLDTAVLAGQAVRADILAVGRALQPIQSLAQQQCDIAQAGQHEAGAPADFIEQLDDRTALSGVTVAV